MRRPECITRDGWFTSARDSLTDYDVSSLLGYLFIRHDIKEVWSHPFTLHVSTRSRPTASLFGLQAQIDASTNIFSKAAVTGQFGIPESSNMNLKLLFIYFTERKILRKII